MSALKTVPGKEPLTWQTRHTWANCRCPVEVEAAEVAQMVLVASLEIPEHWVFELRLHGDPVYRVDVRPVGNHPNPINRPDGFPRKVPEKVHEHVYVEGLSDRCARPLEDQSIGDHAAMFERFCARSRLTCGRPHTPPPRPQPRLGL